MQTTKYFIVANEKLLCLLDGSLAILLDVQLQLLSCKTKTQQAFLNGDKELFTVVDVHEQDIEGYQWLNLRAQLGRIPEHEFQLAGKALQVLRWHYDHQFCGRCGSPTKLHKSDMAKRCDLCELDFYPKLLPCIITLVTKGDYCLLAWHARSKEERYSCLAGFIEAGESPEQTLVREVMEEVGVVVNNIRYVSSQPWPFPGQLMLGYMADFVAGEIRVDRQEIKAANWYRFDQLPTIPPRSTISGQLIDEFVKQRSSLHRNNN